MTMPMVKYMTAINSVFVALVVAAYIFSTKGVSQELVLNMMYYIIITPLLTVAMTKLVYSGEQEMTLVDAASDEEVLEALRRAQCMDIINKLPKGINTVIMIAHRLSTVVDANCIYLLENGTCTEFGSHRELMAKRGHYCSMFEEYNRSVLWKVGA